MFKASNKGISAPIAIGIILVLAVLVGGFTIWQYSEMQKEETTIPEIEVSKKETDVKSCTTDDDCVVFGKDGDCNCGCFNKNYSDWQPGGACFCAAPTSCKCTNGKCEGIFEEVVDWEAQLSSSNKANFVYLTDGKYDGKLGGRFGADTKCSPPSGLNCKPETIHAFITVNDNDSIMDMAENYNFNTDLPIYWYNRETNKTTILAINWSKMIGETIINGQKEGAGKGTWPSDFPWTGINIKGGVGRTCNQWTTNEGNRQTGAGPHGEIGGVNKEYWLSSDGWAGKWASTLCVNERHLRCICESNITQ